MQAAYDRAKEYVLRHPFRLSWLADNVELYRKQEAWISLLKDHGAIVAVEQNRLLSRSWGEDFSHLRDRVVSIRLHGPTVTDGVIDILIRDSRLLGRLRILDLASSRVTDGGLADLPALASLQSLILCDTPVIGRGLVKAVGRMPDLPWPI